MILLRFRTPNIVLGYKKGFEMRALCYMVYNPDSVRLLAKPLWKSIFPPGVIY